MRNTILGCIGLTILSTLSCASPLRVYLEKRQMRDRAIANSSFLFWKFKAVDQKGSKSLDASVSLADFQAVGSDKSAIPENAYQDDGAVYIPDLPAGTYVLKRLHVSYSDWGKTTDVNVPLGRNGIQIKIGKPGIYNYGSHILNCEFDADNELTVKEMKLDKPDSERVKEYIVNHLKGSGWETLPVYDAYK